MASTRSARRFRWALAGIVLAGFALRLTWILVSRQHIAFGGDAGFYHLGANLLVDGRGFVSPYHPSRQAADHPPLYIVWLAIPSLVGLRSQLDHLIWSAVLGVGEHRVDRRHRPPSRRRPRRPDRGRDRGGVPQHVGARTAR